MRLHFDHLTKIVVREYALDDAEHINWGWCYHWAYFAYCLYGGQLWSSKDHAFIKINDLFYDSESPDGILDWRRLNCMKRLRQDGLPVSLAHRVEEDEYFELWDKTIIQFNILDKVRHLIRQAA